jgi:cyclopropane-fatty-acyl-phospholipid synthase
MNATVFDTRELPQDRPAPGLLGWAERGWLPDVLVRAGIRRACAQRLEDESLGGLEAQSMHFDALIAQLRASPLAIETDAANAQHYELPPEFFRLCLGARLKYSSCLYPRGDESLDAAEEAMLTVTCERAALADGLDILELGCGWGSLTLWMAERYPGARITAVSNSRPQRLHIEAQCAARGLSNVRVLTCDVNRLALDAGTFDRVVSVEMFEHLRNYEALFARVFCHRTLMYPFETQGDGNWLGRHFFTGGLMPAADTLLHFQRDLVLDRRWLLDGRHYARTAEHWLQRPDAQREAVMAVLREAYGAGAALWFQRWRMFWMACAELFAYADGQEWGVAHYRFRKPA